MKSKFYTVNQIAEMFEMHPKTIRRYIRDRHLKASKIGGQWRVSEVELKQFLDGNVELREEWNNQWQEDLKGFIDGRNTKEDGKFQVVTIIDIFVESSEEAKELATSLMEVINDYNSFDRTKAQFRYLYEPEINKARFILSGAPSFIGQVVNVLENL